MTHPGQCLCGEVRFTIDAEPLAALMCWCRDCQRLASGSPTINVIFPANAAHYEGPVTSVDKAAESGTVIRYAYCAECGTHLNSTTVDPAGLPIRVRAGTLDDPQLMAPQAVIWTSSAPDWAVLDPALPHFPKRFVPQERSQP